MRKRTKPEEFVAKLRQVKTERRRDRAEAARSIGVAQQTYCRGRAGYGSMEADQVKRLKLAELGSRA